MGERSGVRTMVRLTVGEEGVEEARDRLFALLWDGQVTGEEYDACLALHRPRRPSILARLRLRVSSLFARLNPARSSRSPHGASPEPETKS
jgi:hypothetical protein